MMVLVFASSDKGGTGRSVTSCNMAYWASMGGRRVAYLDFDFGSPTAGGTFEIRKLDRGVSDGSGTHAYLAGRTSDVGRVSVHAATDRRELQRSRHPSGQLVLLPGDRGSGEFTRGVTDSMVQRCAALLATCEGDFDLTFIDLSAGRSAALSLVLRATKHPLLANVVSRWLVFHRWTREHIVSTYGLVHGEHGLLGYGAACGHDADELRQSVRFVRTAVLEFDTPASRPPQSAWLREQYTGLKKSATHYGMGSTAVLGTTPIEPMLQCREQVILDDDVATRIANQGTVDAFRKLAQQLTNPAVWERE